jgi:hypothetical protein
VMPLTATLQIISGLSAGPEDESWAIDANIGVQVHRGSCT